MLCVSSNNGFLNNGIVAVMVSASLRSPGMSSASDAMVSPTAIQLRVLIDLAPRIGLGLCLDVLQQIPHHEIDVHQVKAPHRHRLARGAEVTGDVVGARIGR